MADVFETIERVARGIEERLTVKTAYGDPVSANGVTEIPVSRIRFGFGGGGGGGTGTGPGHGQEGEAPLGSGGGGGGGGGASIEPLGFIEISDAGARWVPLEPPRGELALRALMTAAVLAPGGGRRGFFRRVALVALGQALVSALSRSRMPASSEPFRFGRRSASEAA